MTKYGISDDHEWPDEKQRAEKFDRTRITDHEVDVIYTTDPGEAHGYGRERYTVTLRYDDDADGPHVLMVVKHRWKGNYWRDTHDLDWRDTPDPVREAVAAVLPVDRPDDLDSGVRMFDEGGESRYKKYYKSQVESMDAGDMWGSSYLSEALDSAEKAAEALDERDLDAAPAENAVDELQRAITTLKTRGEGSD